MNDPVNFIDPNGEYGIAVGLVVGGVAGFYIARDIKNFINDEPSVCGKVQDYFRNKFSDDAKKILGVPSSNAN